MTHSNGLKSVVSHDYGEGKRILHLHVKRKYWDEVKQGKKQVEYRRFDLKLLKRLLIGFDLIYYHLGYPSKPYGDRTLVFKWNGFYDTKVKHEIFGAKPVHAFVIDLSKKEDALPPSNKLEGIRANVL